jgi:hypothetical protein
MSSPSAPAPVKQPKVVQKLLVRTLVLVLVLGGALMFIQRTRQKDTSRTEKADTAGWISAVEYKNDGSEAVAIKPDLTVVRASGWKEGATDRDVAWAPNGNFLFFVSDRSEGGFHVFRWNPQRPEAEVRTVGTRGRSNPTFKVKQDPNDLTMLITSGGVVMEFDPSERAQTLVLPPVGREITVGSGDESGAQSQFAAMYGQIGNSFRYARWCGDDDHVVAIMRRDEGEVLIIQNMQVKDGSYGPPNILAAGERIEFDVSPANGDVVFTVNGFQWPGAPPEEFVKNGKLTEPFQHYAGIWKKAEGVLPPIVASNDDKASFGSPAINPSGETVLLAVGPYRDGAVAREGLFSFPAKPGAGREGKPFLRGEIYEPSWDPTGTRVVYIKRDGPNRSVYTARSDGSSEQSITSNGNFAFPKFSPQTK